MQNQFFRIGDYAINWDSVQFVRKVKGDNGFYYHVFLIDKKDPLSFVESSPEGKALLHWWENSVSALQDGSEPIPFA
jgi:hypothetical protein